MGTFGNSACTGTATLVGSAVTVTNGVVPNSASQTFSTAGSYGWEAIYTGDSNNAGATSPCEQLTVGLAITTSLSSSKITAGQSVTDSATLHFATGTAGGTVVYSFFNDGVCTGPSTLVGSAVTVTNGVVPNSASQTFNSNGSYQLVGGL